MASSFLREKAKAQTKRIDEEWGSTAYMGSDYAPPTTQKTAAELGDSVLDRSRWSGSYVPGTDMNANKPQSMAELMVDVAMGSKSRAERDIQRPDSIMLRKSSGQDAQKAAAANTTGNIARQTGTAKENYDKAMEEYRLLSSLEQAQEAGVNIHTTGVTAEHPYATAEEALAAAKQYKQQTRELANQYYYEENPETLQTLRADKKMSAQYDTAKELQADMDKLAAVMEEATSKSGNTEVLEARKYLEEKYGLTQEAVNNYAIGGAQYIPAGDGYTNIYQLYTELESKKKKAVKTLSKAGYDYDRLTGYEKTVSDAEEYKQKQAEWQDYANEHPVLSSVDSVLVSPFQGVDYATTMAKGIGHSNTDDLNTYEPLNVYDMNATNYVSAVRGTVSKKIEENTDWELFGKNVGSFLYETGMSVADSAVQVGTFGSGAVWLMGASAASNQARDIIQRGGTNDQAFWGGLASGAAEVFFEKISVEQLLSPKSVDSWKSLLRETLKQAGTEASEETLTEIANILSDAAIMGENSQFSQSVAQYRQEKHMTEEQAKRQAFLDCVGQVAWAGAGGALSGGVMGGVTSAAQMNRSGGIKADTSLFDRSILENPNTARTYFIDYARNNFPQSVVNQDTGKTIGISRIGLDKFLSGDIKYEKYATGFHIPALVEQGVKTGQAANYHSETADSIPTFEYYDSPIQVDGTDYVAHIRVKNTRMGDKYYGHTISEVDNIAIEPATRSSSSQSDSVHPVHITDSINDSIPTSTGKVNPENAEPMTMAEIMAEVATRGTVERQQIENAHAFADSITAQQRATQTAQTAPDGAFTAGGESVPGTTESTVAVQGNNQAGTVQHTPEQQAVIEEYQAAVDPGAVAFMEDSVAHKGENSRRYRLDNVSDRAAGDIQRITGVDVRGNKTVIEQRIAEHIYNEHGPEGTTDQSMKDLNDFGRIQYVLDNYDTATDGGYSRAYVTNKGNGRTGQAKTVIFQKAIDGTFYVVEAVPDTTAKTVYVVSAYIEQNNKTGALRSADVGTASSVPPAITSETSSTDAPAVDISAAPYEASSIGGQDTGTSKNSIPNPSGKVNPETAKPVTMAELMAMPRAEREKTTGKRKASRESIAHAAERVMKNGIVDVKHRGSFVLDGEQYVTDGYRLIRFREPMELTQAGELFSGAKDAAARQNNLAKVLKQDAQNETRVELPAVEDLRAGLTAAKRQEKNDLLDGWTGDIFWSRANTKVDAENYRYFYDFGEDKPLVNAQYLVDMLTILPDSEAYVDEGNTSRIYFKAENGDGILLPMDKDFFYDGLHRPKRTSEEALAAAWDEYDRIKAGGSSMSEDMWKHYMRQMAWGGTLPEDVSRPGTKGKPAEPSESTAPAGTEEQPTPGNERPEMSYNIIDGADKEGQEAAISKAYDTVIDEGRSVDIPLELLDKYKAINQNPAQKLLTAVKEFYQEHLKGKAVSVELNGNMIEIHFENDGMKKSVGWRMKVDKAATFERLLDLTENARYAYSETNRDANEANSVPLFHYYVADAVIDGTHVPIKIQVRDIISDDGSKETRYYTHNIKRDIAGLGHGTQAETPGASYPRSNGNIPKDSIPTSGENVNSESAGNAKTAVTELPSIKGFTVYSAVPEGWRVNRGGTTAPQGYVMVDNGKSHFGGEYQYAIVPESAVRGEMRSDGLGAADAGSVDPNSLWQMEADEYYPVNERAAAETLETRGRVPFDMPTKDMHGARISRQAATLANAKMTTNEMAGALETEARHGTFSYIEYSDADAMAKAETRISGEGMGWYKAFGAYEEAVRSGKTSKDTTALGIALYNSAVNGGKLMEAMDVASLMVQNSRNVAQSLQVMNMINKADPDTRLYFSMRGLENLKNQVKAKYGERGNVEVDGALVDDYKKALASRDEAAIETAWSAIEQNVADQIPATFADKLNAWRYLSMLGNFRTHIRNISGNAGFAPVRAIKNFTATTVESAASLFTGGEFQRTKAFLNRASEADRALINTAWKYFPTVEEDIQSGGKYSDALNDLDSKRTIYKAKGLEAVRKANTKALDTEDTWFSRPAFTNALASWMKANKVTAEAFAADPASYADGISYAVKEAQKATYRDSNAFSDKVSRWGKNYTGDKAGWKATNIFVEAALPFKRTPANILVRGVEYSPAGLVKSLYDGLAKVRKGTMTAAELIDEISAGLTGSLLLGLGVLLSSKGAISGGDDEDDNQSAFDKLMGYQNYALNIGDKSYTIDWLAPGAMPLFVGVELHNAKKDGFTAAELFNALGDLADPMVEMSMLSGLADLVEDVSRGDTAGDKVAKGIASLAVNYLTQYIPTIAGQLERTIETEREETYRYGDSALGLGPDAQYTIGKAANKIPGVDYHQIPYIDAWGQTEDSGPLYARIGNNFFNPAYVSDIQKTEVNRELQRLYDATEGAYAVYPSRPAQSTKIAELDGDYMTAEEYVQYAQTRGGTALEMISGLIGTDMYKAMSDKDKAEVITAIYAYATDRARGAIVEGRDIEYKYDYKSLSGVEDIAGAFALKQAVETLADSEGADAAGFDAAFAWYKSQTGSQQAALREGISGLDKLAGYLSAGNTGTPEQFYAAKKYHDELDKDESMSATEKAENFAVWLDRQGYTVLQKANLKSSLAFFSHIPADTSKYDELTEGGLSTSKADKVWQNVSALEPEAGHSNVRDIQKYESITGQAGLSEDEKLSALEVYATESAYNYYRAAYDYGIDLDKWTAVQRYIADEKNGKISYAGVKEAFRYAGLTEKECMEMWDVYAYYHQWTKSYYQEAG